MKPVRITNRYVHGAVSLERTEGGLKPWRLPYRQRLLFPSPNDGLVNAMALPDGIRLMFETDSRVVEVGMAPRAGAHDAPQPLLDLVIGGDLVRTEPWPWGSESVRFVDLPAGPKTCEVWLPHRGLAGVGLVLKRLLVEDGASIRPVADERPRWIAYGSSITQCSGAHSPARTWPAVAARRHGLALTCLGFGGQCHMDPMLARMIRDLPADVITLKVGINVQGGSSLSPRTFKAAVIGMVQIIREKHKQVPIGLISPIVSPPREKTPNAVGLTLEAMRAEIEDAARRIRDATGDERVLYFSGLDLFGPELVGPRLPDNLHPDGDGYEILGRNAAERLLPVLLAMRG